MKDLTDRDILIQIHTKLGNQEERMDKIENKLDKHLEGGNCTVQRELTDHKTDHRLEKRSRLAIIIAIPTFISAGIAVIAWLTSKGG